MNKDRFYTATHVDHRDIYLKYKFDICLPIDFVVNEIGHTPLYLHATYFSNTYFNVHF